MQDRWFYQSNCDKFTKLKEREWEVFFSRSEELRKFFRWWHQIYFGNTLRIFFQKQVIFLKWQEWPFIATNSLDVICPTLMCVFFWVIDPCLLILSILTFELWYRHHFVLLNHLICRGNIKVTKVPIKWCFCTCLAWHVEYVLIPCRR